MKAYFSALKTRAGRELQTWPQCLVTWPLMVCRLKFPLKTVVLNVTNDIIATQQHKHDDSKKRIFSLSLCRCSHYQHKQSIMSLRHYVMSLVWTRPQQRRVARANVVFNAPLEITLTFELDNHYLRRFLLLTCLCVPADMILHLYTL